MTTKLMLVFQVLDRNSGTAITQEQLEMVDENRLAMDLVDAAAAVYCLRQLIDPKSARADLSEVSAATGAAVRPPYSDKDLEYQFNQAGRDAAVNNLFNALMQLPNPGLRAMIVDQMADKYTADKGGKADAGVLQTAEPEKLDVLIISRALERGARS